MRIIFAGTPDFAVPVLQTLHQAGHEICAVYTQPDRPKGRGRKSSFSPVKQFALENELAVYQPVSLRNAEAQAKMANLNADLMVVVAYGLILPQTVLSLPKHGCFNVHASLLPKFRGASPIQAAILVGDKESGVTIMKMDAGLDTGDMVLTAKCTIDDMDTAQTLHDKLSPIGAKAMLDVVGAIESCRVEFEKQNDALATYAHKITKQDACINWQQSADEIVLKIRAYNPWPVAYTEFADQTIRIWQASVVKTDNAHACPPGDILSLNKSELIVACRRNALRLEVIQLPGSRAMAIKDCLNAKFAFFESIVKCQEQPL